MQATTVEDQILSEIRRMAPEQQHRLLHFARTLARPGVKGVPGASLLQFAGMIPADQVRQMEAAIERDCEKVDPNGW